MVIKHKVSECQEHILVNDEEHGEILCAKCGRVIQDKTEEAGAEWRSFENQPDRGRTGDGTCLSKHDMGLATIISRSNKDVTGKPLSVGMKNTIERLRMWDNRSQAYSAGDRNLRQAFSQLLSLKEKLGLSDAVIEKTAYIYRKAHEKKITRGRPISAFLCATLYAACRETETPRTLKEISKSSMVKVKQINKCYRILVERFDLRMPLVDPIVCVSRIANKAGVSEKTKREAANILKEYERKETTAGKSPMVVAATAVYIATLKNNDGFTQRDIAQAANVTEVAIRNRTASIRCAIGLA
ncbi:transcription initiation factor IIB [Candidatus Nitrosotenuis aquarius]|uniref:transcription initiation factor IIB n=1 Tax=Candidatus Nitrosotenuis aquarius TaxID=1846278 RepID=UPI000C1ED720|nr:TFIIB-type zinc ribbon-containing protein [Candidatus Nitrosotenuis aquarius]